MPSRYEYGTPLTVNEFLSRPKDYRFCEDLISSACLNLQRQIEDLSFVKTLLADDKGMLKDEILRAAKYIAGHPEILAEGSHSGAATEEI